MTLKKNSTPTWADVAKLVTDHLRASYETPEEAMQTIASAGMNATESRNDDLKLDRDFKRKESGLSRIFTPTRHDKKRVAGGGGYVYRNGYLMKRMKYASADRRAERIAKSLLTGVGGLFSIGGAQVYLETLLSRARFAISSEDIPRLEKAYEAYSGYKVDAPPAWWEGLLDGQLLMHAHHVEERRLRKEHGDPDAPSTGDPGLDAAWAEVNAKLEARRTWPKHALDGPVSGEELLAHLEHEAERSKEAVRRAISRGHSPEAAASLERHLPPELTAEVLQEMLDQVTLGRGGGRYGKKSAKILVDEFAKKIRARDARGNSRG